MYVLTPIDAPDLEMEDECPDKPQDELLVAIHDLVIPYVHQLDVLLHLKKVQCILNVLEFVDPHFAFLPRL